MRTRNTKKPDQTGQTPPAKKGSKTPTKAVAAESPALKAEQEGRETKATSESVEIEGEAKAEGTSIENTPEANEDGKNVEASAEGPKEADLKVTKVASPASAKKQKKVTPSKRATAEGFGEGVAHVAGKEAVSMQPVAVKVEESNGKKDLDTIEIEDDAVEAKAETDPEAEMEVEDVPEDEVMEEGVEEDDEEVEEPAEEEGVEGEEGDDGVENEEASGDDVEEEEENEGDEAEDEEVGEEEVEGEELEEADIAEEHPELQEPRPVTERQKRKRLEVFVGGLDKEATEDDVKKAFENVGEVVEVRLMRNIKTGKNKGYAFVRFATAEQATRAATELNRTQIKGKSCNVVPSEDNDVLFLGNINKSWKKHQVEEKLKEYAIEGIEELTLMEDLQNEGMNRGFAFVELATHNDAIKALKCLAKPNVIFGSDRSAVVAWARQNEPDEAVMSQVKSVFVDGILSSWTEEKVKELFSKYGEIERIVLARNMPTSKRSDFAFINYAVRDAAIACIDALNENDLVDGENKIKVKVKLARPQPSGRRGKRGLRGGYPVDRSFRPARGKGGALRGRVVSRNPVRGGRGLLRGRSRPFGRERAAYEGPPAHKVSRVPRQRRLEDRPFPVERSRDRQPIVGPPRPARVPLRGDFSRREDTRRGRVGYPDRPSHDYRGRRDDIGDDYPPPSRGGGFFETVPSRGGRSVHRPLPPPRDDGYVRHVDRGYDYVHNTSDVYSRSRGYGESGRGKRPYSLLEEDDYYEPPPHGYTRARIDYDVPAPPPPSEYESGRVPLGRSGYNISAGRGPAHPLPVSQPSFGVYDQPSTLGGGGSGSLYGSGTRGYGSSVPGAGDYSSSGAEIRGSSFYANRPSGGYGYAGAGSSSYY